MLKSLLEYIFSVHPESPSKLSNRNSFGKSKFGPHRIPRKFFVQIFLMAIRSLENEIFCDIIRVQTVRALIIICIPPPWNINYPVASDASTFPFVNLSSSAWPELSYRFFARGYERPREDQGLSWPSKKEENTGCTLLRVYGRTWRKRIRPAGGGTRREAAVLMSFVNFAKTGL